MDRQMDLSESPPWATTEKSIPVLAPSQLLCGGFGSCLPSSIQLHQCVLEWASGLHEQESAWAAGVSWSAMRVQWFLWHCLVSCFFRILPLDFTVGFVCVFISPGYLGLRLEYFHYPVSLPLSLHTHSLCLSLL